MHLHMGLKQIALWSICRQKCQDMSHKIPGMDYDLIHLAVTVMALLQILPSSDEEAHEGRPHKYMP